MISFTKVHSKQEITDVSTLAQKIWQEHYLSIVGQEQINYMLERFQSEQAITMQLSEGYEYYLLNYNKHNTGYMAIIPNTEDSSLMLSKIYVKKSERGLGSGKQMLHFVETLCKKRKLKKVWLTVNKHNTHSIEWYLRMGFTKEAGIIQNIGGGFLMDDFRMEKSIL